MDAKSGQADRSGKETAKPVRKQGSAKRVMQDQKRVNVDFPAWMLESLDKEASRVGVTRQSIIKVWLAERLEQLAANKALPRKSR
ncbi:MAG: type II toxin-antitoxin system BrnA family antitoxin [Methylococcales bacterium]